MTKTLKMLPAALAAGIAAVFCALCLVPATAHAADMSDVQGVLYDDGALVIQNGSTTDAAKTVAEGPKAINGKAQLHTLFTSNKVQTINVTADIDVLCKGFFQDLGSCTTIDVADGRKVALGADASETFSGCWQLATLDVAGFDTTALTNMSLMFYGCESLRTLDLSTFNTAAVTNMQWMFSNCVNLNTLNLSSFDSRKVTSAAGMFEDCNAIRQITLGAQFSFKGDSSRLPEAYWQDQAGKVFTSTTMPNETAATYIRTSMTLQPMYRVYNKWSNEHFFTTDSTEYKGLVAKGWNDEGVAWYSPEKSSTPVYRLYNKYTTEHHFTTSKTEYDKCVKDGWTGEDVAFYSGGNTPVYRLFNQYEKAFYHHYTKSEEEKATCVKNGWTDEEIGWYCY